MRNEWKVSWLEPEESSNGEFLNEVEILICFEALMLAQDYIAPIIKERLQSTSCLRNFKEQLYQIFL